MTAGRLLAGRDDGDDVVGAAAIPFAVAMFDAIAPHGTLLGCEIGALKHSDFEDWRGRLRLNLGY